MSNPLSGDPCERDTLALDLLEEGERLRIHHQLQEDPFHMADDAPGDLDELPPDRGDGMRRPRGGRGEVLELNEQIVGEYAQPKEDRIRVRIAAGHPLQTKLDLQLLMEVLRLAPLAVPQEDRVGGLQLGGLVARDGMVDVGLLVKEVWVAPARTLDGQAKGVRARSCSSYGRSPRPRSYSRGSAPARPTPPALG